MKNNNQNNQPQWVKRVLEYEAVHEAPGDKEASLRRFRERMEQASPAKRKKAVGRYWMAAASVILFFGVRFILAPGPGKAINPDVVKENKNPAQPTAIIPNNNNTITTANKPIQRSRSASHAGSRQQPISNKEQNLPVYADSADKVVTDSPLVTNDTAAEEEELVTFHINDFPAKEPLPKNTTIKSLTVKKALRLFGADITGGKPVKVPDGIPKKDSSLTNNQN